MRVLVDECLPRQLRQWLLIARPDWTIMVTADKNMHRQQNFAGLSISVLVFPTNRAKLVRAGVLALVQSLPRVRPGEKVVMDLAQTQDWASANLADVVVEQGITRHVFRS